MESMAVPLEQFITLEYAYIYWWAPRSRPVLHYVALVPRELPPHRDAFLGAVCFSGQGKERLANRTIPLPLLRSTQPSAREIDTKRSMV